MVPSTPRVFVPPAAVLSDIKRGEQQRHSHSNITPCLHATSGGVCRAIATPPPGSLFCPHPLSCRLPGSGKRAASGGGFTGDGPSLGWGGGVPPTTTAATAVAPSRVHPPLPPRWNVRSPLSGRGVACAGRRWFQVVLFLLLLVWWVGVGGRGGRPSSCRWARRAGRKRVFCSCTGDSGCSRAGELLSSPRPPPQWYRGRCRFGTPAHRRPRLRPRCWTLKSLMRSAGRHGGAHPPPSHHRLFTDATPSR